MKVYLLMENFQYEGDVVLGVFSTKDLAEAAMARGYEKGHKSKRLFVQEWVVDEEPEHGF
jgi:hypothetical protein